MTSNEPLKRKEYQKELRAVQVELCALQEWVKEKGLRVIVVFEGRDAAGKGGMIKAITDRVSHRVFRVVALPAPSDRERSQLYMQRFIQHSPAAGEIVIFDRSWYNRAGVEYVPGFLLERAARALSKSLPGVRTVRRGRRHQVDQILARGERRGAEAPLRGPHHGSVAPVEAQPDRPMLAEPVVRLLRARDMMLEATDTEFAPWYIVPSDDKRRARLNCISHLLSLIPYKKVPREKVKLPKRSKQGAYDDQATLKVRRFVPANY